MSGTSVWYTLVVWCKENLGIMAQNYVSKNRGKIVNARVDKGIQGNKVFQTQQDWHTNELLEIVAACSGMSLG